MSLGLAALACPCHLTIAVGLLAGTALGAWLLQHRFVVTLVMLGVFTAALRYGLRGLNGLPLAEDVTQDKISSIPSGEIETTGVGGMEKNGYST